MSGGAEIVRREATREREREKRGTMPGISTGTWHKYIIHLCGGVPFQGVPRQSFIFEVRATLRGPLREWKKGQIGQKKGIDVSFVRGDRFVRRSFVLFILTAPHQAYQPSIPRRHRYQRYRLNNADLFDERDTHNGRFNINKEAER